ncbi:MAG: TVP38/TMEM64 family protein [Gemmatimonadota bacterium]
MRPAFRVRLGRDDVVRLAILLALFGAVFVVALLTDSFDRVTPRQVRDGVRAAGVWAPAFYIAGFFLRPLTLAPLTLWLVAGGIAFGWSWAALYALVGVNLSAAAVFLGARWLGRDFVARLLGSRVARVRPARWNARFVLSLQLFPLMNHDLLNVAAACSGIPYWRFLAGSSLGTLPGVLLYTYAGSVLMAPGSPQFYVAFTALAALSIVALVAARRARRRPAWLQTTPAVERRAPAWSDDPPRFHRRREDATLRP